MNKPSRAWQRMLSGRRLDILDPSPLDIEIEDIALGLSRVARWNGQTVGDYGFSVAQHAILVVDLMRQRNPTLPNSALLAGLLHDAPEYVTSDLITPFKQAIGAAYLGIEEKMAQAIHQAFGLPAILPDEWTKAIKQADHTSAFLEAVQLAGFEEFEARSVLGYRGAAPLISLTAWSAEKARSRFRTEFTRLREARKGLWH